MVLYIFRGYCIKLSIDSTFMTVNTLAFFVWTLMVEFNSLACKLNADQYFYQHLTTVTPLLFCLLGILSFHFFSCKFCTVTCSYVNILLSKMKFLIAIVLYRIERKLTPLLKTNLSVFANVFFSLNLFSSWIYFSWYSKILVYLRGCCFLKMHFGFLYCFVLSSVLEVWNFMNLKTSLLS